jgi:hypothetical protein
MDVMDAMAHGLLHNAGVATIHPWVLGGGMGPTDWDGSGLGFIPLGEPGSVILDRWDRGTVQNTKQTAASSHTPSLSDPGIASLSQAVPFHPTYTVHTPLIWFVTRQSLPHPVPVLLSSPRRSWLTTVALSLSPPADPTFRLDSWHSLLLFVETN